MQTTEDDGSEASREAAPEEAPAQAAAAPAGAGVVPEPVEVSDADVGAGARLGVWVAGTILVALLLLAIFGLG